MCKKKCQNDIVGLDIGYLKWIKSSWSCLNKNCCQL